jgi:hypothetical protein
MIDGLALGETTPGPLIMVVAFVGFVGGWLRAVLGPDALWPVARRGTVVTFFLSCRRSCSFSPAARWSKPRTASSASLHAVGHHRSVVGDPEPGAVLRLARVVAAGFGGHSMRSRLSSRSWPRSRCSDSKWA